MTTTRPPVKYALLRAGESWPDATLDGLEVRPDGALELLAVPRVAEARMDAPGSAPPSGLALDDRCGLYVADTAGGRMIRVALDCGDRAILDDQAAGPEAARFRAPSGLCIGPFGWLFVADGDGGRVLVFSTPDLALRDEWTAGLSRPVGLASLGDRGVVVLDTGLSRVLRFDPWGRPDPGFGSFVAPPTGPAAPRAIATGPDGTVYVADALSGGVSRFAPDGQPAGPQLAVTTKPQAMAAGGEALYAADEDTGRVLLFSLPEGRPLGAVQGFRGPVSALALDRTGRLYIKPGSDEEYLVAEPAAARVASGSVTAGPLDAGEDSGWLRVVAKAEIPPEGAVVLETFAGEDEAATPVWRRADSIDTLIEGSRYVWVRVTLERNGHDASPRILQVQAETAGDSYIDHLPRVYSRDPSASEFLRRLLSLAKSELGDLEALIASLPRLFNPDMAPAGALPWLASAKAFDLPPALADLGRPADVRALLSRLPELYRRRGTRRGVVEFVELYAGTHAHLFESFHARGEWILGDTSVLGFDTLLPPSSVDGVVLGNAEVGASGPQAQEDWGAALFDPWAHRFTVMVPKAAATSEDQRRAIRRVVDDEKPAHTSVHVCFIDPRMRVGLQSRVGVDTIVAVPSEGLMLDDGPGLDVPTPLADAPEETGTLGRRSRVGIETRLA